MKRKSVSIPQNRELTDVELEMVVGGGRLIPLTQVRLYVVGATRGRSVLLRGLSRLMMSQ